VRAFGVIALALALGAAAAAASSRPALRVDDLSPFTIHGLRFEPGEHLRIVVSAKRTYVRRIEAGRKGGFTLRLRRLSLGRCGLYSVRAYDASGLRAGVKSSPQSCGADIGPT
jgi:hypothetical protein